MDHSETKHETRDERILRLFKDPISHGITKLYKYMSMAPEKIKYLEEVFRGREVFFPSPLKFNDPFECRPSCTWHRKGKELRDYIGKLVRERFPHSSRPVRRQRIKEGEKRFLKNQDCHMNDLFERFLNDTGLYCLSEISDNILMWSHYANGHDGVVLEFDRTKAYSLFYDALGVHYSEEYPRANLMELGEPEDYNNLLLTKSTDWAYEKEWRVIKSPNEGGSQKYKFSNELLTGVILGARIEPQNQKLVLEWVRDYPSEVKVFRSKINDKFYRLDISPLQQGV
jgi:hypothetical protein